MEETIDTLKKAWTGEPRIRDFMKAHHIANAAGLQPGQLGAAYFIPTAFVPLLLITHGLVFTILLQGDRAPARATAVLAA